MFNPIDFDSRVAFRNANDSGNFLVFIAFQVQNYYCFFGIR